MVDSSAKEWRGRGFRVDMLGCEGELALDESLLLVLASWIYFSIYHGCVMKVPVW